MAKIKLSYTITDTALYINTARVKIEVIYKNKNDYQKCCGVYNPSYNCYKTVKKIEEYEIIFTDGLLEALKDSMNKIEYSIKNKLCHNLSYTYLYIEDKYYEYTLKVIDRLKETFGELDEEDKKVIYLPLNDKEWILENIYDAYGSISEELKEDKDILNTYVNCLAKEGIDDADINHIPNHLLNDEKFLLEFKNKMLYWQTDNQHSYNTLTIRTLLKTKIYEVFKELIFPTDMEVVLRTNIQRSEK